MELWKLEESGSNEHQILKDHVWQPVLMFPVKLSALAEGETKILHDIISAT